MALSPMRRQHFAKPLCRPGDVLDPSAAARAYQALNGRLARVDETIETLLAIGRAIDVIYFSL
jgi:hypothetical protein